MKEKTTMTPRLLLFVSLSFILAFSSCLKDKCEETRTFVRYDPVYRSEQQINAKIEVQAPRVLHKPGIIYYYQDHILINEFREGIHIFDNSNPQQPENVAFISIEGNEHFAVSKNVLQANKFVDLISIDISDLKNIQEVNRVKNAFGELYPEEGRGSLVYYRKTEQEMDLDCSEPNFNSLRWQDAEGGFWLVRGVANVEYLAADQADSNSGSSGGIGGSTARFTISKDHLFAVSEFNLNVFDLADAKHPQSVRTQNIGWGIETIYPFGDMLFIGSSSGMYIYDISNPASPNYQSSFDHARACDPVVTDGNTAYVTLRDGTECEGFNNQLDVIDVGNIYSPYLVKTYQMENPHGLAIHDEYLFICEGDFGFKIMQASHRDDIDLIKYYKDLPSKDVIVLPNELILIVGKNGLIQMDVTNPRNLQFVSEIRVEESN